MNPTLELMKGRHSCRAYTSEIPSREKILAAVEAASYAASSKNTQPWKLHVAIGASCDKVRAALLEAFDTGAKGGAEFKYSPDEMPADWMDRARACGYALFEHKGIGRDDKPARRAHDRENFRLFGAPAVAVLSVPRTSERGNFLDAGQFLSFLMLALRAEGYESVPMFSVATQPAALRSTLGIPEDRAIVCALSFGVEDASAHVNAFRTVREKPEELVSWT
jgi:nitroreductase